MENNASELHSFYHPHKRVTFDSGTELITKQEFKDECDINTILASYARTGNLTHVTSQQATFQDLPDALDFQEGLNMVLAAQEAFAGLPADIRDRYKNDPAIFLSALEEPSERPYLTEKGVFKSPPPPPEPSPVPAPSGSGGGEDR